MTSTFPDSSGRGDTADAGQSATTSRPGGDAGTSRVGVLSPHNSKETKAILNAVRALGHDPVWIRDENARSRIEDGNVQLSPEIDVLVNRLLLSKSDRPFEDLQFAALYDEQVPVLNAPDAVARTLHKYRAGVRLAAAGLPVPDSYFGRSPGVLDDWHEHLTENAAHKPTVGTNGRGMGVVAPEDPVGPRIDGQGAFLQEFLDADDRRASDVRVYVVGGDVVGAMRRHAPPGDWRANVARGAEVEDVTDDLGGRPRRIATEAVDVLDLDLAGVDLMTVDDEWYVLEVNATAGFKGLYDATGSSVAPYIARLAVERVGGTVDDDQVNTLAETLDDSVPDCKPSMDEPSADGGVLGYTTRVQVSGRNGAERTVAKSDTGAKRTSIDTDLAGRIGAGPLVGTTRVRSGNSSGAETRPLVDVDLRLNGRWRTVTVSITDRSDMNYPVLLGRDVLEAYTLDISQRVEE